MDAKANFDRTVRRIVRKSDDVSDYRHQARQTAIAHVLEELQQDEAVSADLLERGLGLLETAAKECDAGIDGPVNEIPNSRNDSPDRAGSGNLWGDDEDDNRGIVTTEESSFDGPFVVEGEWETRDEARKYAKEIVGDVAINIWGIDFSEVGPGLTTRVKFNLDDEFGVRDLPDHTKISRL